MSTIVTRAGKGSPLSNSEVDNNFTNLNTDKIQSGDTVASLDINGGTIDGTAIGGATPAAGAFTTLSASSTVTLSGGTANGVAYLDGSKVLTTGSALTFDGAKLSLPTILAIKGAQNGNIAKIAFTRTDGSYSINNETDLRFYVQSGDTESPSSIAHSLNGLGTFVWNNANTATEQMRLTSTGLGIGTSSPAQKLEVANTSGSVAATLRSSNSGYSELYFADVADNAAGAISYEHSSNIMRLYNGGSARVYLDSSGNLGLGVTPSAWGTSYGTKAFDIGAVGSLVGSDTDTLVFNNTYWNGTNFIYKTTAAASYSQQVSGKHAWFTAPSGTAGNAISFTQAMTLDASGNLSIGTTSAYSTLNVGGASGAKIFYTGGTDANNSGILVLGDGNRSQNYVGLFRSEALTTGTLSSLTIGAYENIRFTCSNNELGSQTERMRIDSSGNLLVGTTNTTGIVTGSSVNQGIVAEALGTLVNQVNNNFNMYMSKAAGYTVGGFQVYYTDNTERGSISYNGSVIVYATTSDYRLKTFVSPISDAGSRIDALNPVEYTWNENNKTDRGFFAHEFQSVYPNSVNGTKDAVDAEGKPVYQSMQASSSEVIADLVAEIQSLRKRLAAAGI